MLQLDFHPTGRHFLQIPGPSPVPDRILRAMSLPTIDHRGPEFGVLGLKLMANMKAIFKTQHPVMIYPASGTGAWEAALVNTLSAGDHVLMYETGHFASLWFKLAARLGVKAELLGLKDFLHVLQDLGSEDAKFGTAVVNGGQAHGAQDSVWHRGGARNLQEVTAYRVEIKRNHEKNTPLYGCIFCIQK